MEPQKIVVELDDPNLDIAVERALAQARCLAETHDIEEEGTMGLNQPQLRRRKWRSYKVQFGGLTVEAEEFGDYHNYLYAFYLSEK